MRYNRDVRPILADNCFACHGPDKAHQKGGLRLDVRDTAIGPLKSGNRAIVPGNVDKSMLVALIAAEDEDEMMPPPESRKKLTTLQKEILKRWIAEGGEYQLHWSFVRPVKSALPPIPNSQVDIRNPVDAFIQARLAQEGLFASPAATQATLIRRVTLDLTGLPPTPAEVAAFLADASPSAYNQLVDRLMATRDYAERRAQDWLDLARYADTRGFSDDTPHDIWPWREWVVEAINRNQPFDQFTIDQLAGDLLPQATQSQRIASAFHRNAPQAKGLTYPVEEYRLKGVIDRVNTTGTVWLGLTVGCAECHDHKFDPVSQVDYYRMFALFNSIEHTGNGFDQGGPGMSLQTENSGTLSVPIMKELAQPRDTFVHLRGNFLSRGEKVAPGVPALFGLTENEQPRNRLEFARWLVNGQNPLVARVVVNRIWQGYFGHGLVRTPLDFGLQGEWPTHPELLDWLACEFVESGWNMKALHRLIVTSATYRQSAGRAEPAASRDMENRWLAWMPRVRLPAEQIRDQALTAGGLLNRSAVGRSFFPPQPDNYWEDRDLPGKWIASSGDSIHRKSLYIYWRRMALHPTMELLDAPSRAICTARRNIANLPTQALVTLNDPLFVEAARAVGSRTIQEAGSESAARMNFAFRLVLGRPPVDEERQHFITFVTDQAARHPGNADAVWESVATVLLNLDETLTRP
ncbi:MAG: DUF1553 domain-containing protein [Pedosphaera sp.]|nr:DUF1553 domain-containing protein [Pedosphaera sp.]